MGLKLAIVCSHSEVKHHLEESKCLKDFKWNSVLRATMQEY